MPHTGTAAQSPEQELLTQTLNTIFEKADEDSAPEIVFELQRASEPTEVAGSPPQLAPAVLVMMSRRPSRASTSASKVFQASSEETS